MTIRLPVSSKSREVARGNVETLQQIFDFIIRVSTQLIPALATFDAHPAKSWKIQSRHLFTTLASAEIYSLIHHVRSGRVGGDSFD